MGVWTGDGLGIWVEVGFFLTKDLELGAFMRVVILERVGDNDVVMGGGAMCCCLKGGDDGAEEGPISFPARRRFCASVSFNCCFLFFFQMMVHILIS